MVDDGQQAERQSSQTQSIGLDAAYGCPREIARELASVPTTAPYGAVQILRIENLNVFTELNGAPPVPSVADFGLHKAIFVGDTNADGQYTAQDAGWISSVVVQATSGFDAYPLVDPVLIADVTQNGIIDGLDASWLSRKGLSPALQPEIPNLPAGSLALFAGADPTLSLDRQVPANRGSTVQVPLRITDSASGLWGVDATVAYESGKLDMLSGLNRSDVQLAGMFATEAGWTIDSYTDDATGLARLSIYRSTPSDSTQGQIATLAFHVDANAPVGESPLTLSVTRTCLPLPSITSAAACLFSNPLSRVCWAARSLAMVPRSVP